MKLRTGDTVPLISLPDKDGNLFQFDSLKGIGPFVVYFYPRNFTPGCTTEACEFRDRYQDFKDMGAEVIAISTDSEESHQKFVDKYNLPFIFLSDKDKKAIKIFGVKSPLLGLLPGRETFVFDKTGTLTMRYNSINAAKHTTKALEEIKSMQS